MDYSKNNFKLSFWQNSTLLRLIYANFAVFVGIKILYLVSWLFQTSTSPNQWALDWMSVPASIGSLIFKPWTVISYMFLHLDFWHIFSNMLWLYFLGQLFVEFLGSKKLWTVYIAGGLAGALLYIFFFNVFPVFREVMPISKALGASASVMAIVVAIGTYAPDFSIRLLFLGNVKLKYIALFWVAFDLFSISNSNSGGHIAHLGGAVLGYLFARQWKQGKDITSWVDSSTLYLQALFSNRSKKMKVSYRNNKSPKTATRSADQAEVDMILDKISKSGYDSLSKTEKDILFRASNK